MRGYTHYGHGYGCGYGRMHTGEHKHCGPSRHPLLAHPDGADGVGGGGRDVHRDVAQLLGLLVGDESSLQRHPKSRLFQMVRPSQLTFQMVRPSQLTFQMPVHAPVQTRVADGAAIQLTVHRRHSSKDTGSKGVRVFRSRSSLTGQSI